jgi:uncharacterized membrane protein YqaE (UPF0057 family)
MNKMKEDNMWKKKVLIGGIIGVVYAIFGPFITIFVGLGMERGENILAWLLIILTFLPAMTYFTLDDFLRCSNIIRGGYPLHQCSGSILPIVILHLFLWFSIGGLLTVLYLKIRNKKSSNEK